MHTPDREAVAIDVRYLSHGLVGGVHTYVHNLVRALLTTETNLNFVLWADTKAPFELSTLPNSASLEILPWSGPFSSVQNDMRIGRAIADRGAGVIHFPANYGFAPPGIPAVVTLHDAINLLPLVRIWRTHSKHPKSLLMMTYLHLMTTRAVRRQPFVVTVSEYSRQEIIRHGRLPEHQVRVIYEAPEAVFNPVPDSLLAELRVRHRLRKYVLLADAIKNPMTTLRAYRSLPNDLRSQTTLVFFSRRPPSMEIQQTAATGECLLLVRPTQDELVSLYNLADVFIFPSWYEGFGLPVLEAMACGTPVIASSSGSLPEVVGDGGMIVDAEDHAAIAELTSNLLRNRGLHAEASQRSAAWASRFSWEETASQMSDFYIEIMGQRTREMMMMPRLSAV